MAAFGGLPPALLRLVLVYEGGILKAYAIALIRRLSVRSYQSILSRTFRFYGLERYCFAHLIRLMQTEVFSVQRFRGVTTNRVYRKSIIPWMPWIHTLQMRNCIHDMLMRMLYLYPEGHPMFRVQTEWTKAWFLFQRTLILGVRGPDNTPTIQKYLRVRDAE